MIERDMKQTTPSLASFGFVKLAKKQHPMLAFQIVQDLFPLPLHHWILCFIVETFLTTSLKVNIIALYGMHKMLVLLPAVTSSLGSTRIIPCSLQLNVIIHSVELSENDFTAMVAFLKTPNDSLSGQGQELKKVVKLQYITTRRCMHQKQNLLLRMRMVPYQSLTSF